MKISVTMVLLWLGLTGTSWAAAPEGSLREGMVNPGYEEKPHWFKSSFLDLGEDIAEAREAGKRVGELIAERAKSQGVETVVFDRSGFQYHGVIRAIADGAREAGLKF